MRATVVKIGRWRMATTLSSKSVSVFDVRRRTEPERRRSTMRARMAKTTMIAAASSSG